MMIQQYNISVPEHFIENIYKLQQESKPTTLRSNKGGWQSKQYTTFKDIPWAKEFYNNCISTAKLTNPLIQIWFNINPNGAFHTWHSHGNASTVGVYYIQVPNNSGNIEFRGKINTAVTPYESLLLIFPAGVDHQVLRNKSTSDRITMAFNLGPTT